MKNVSGVFFFFFNDRCDVKGKPRKEERGEERSGTESRRRGEGREEETGTGKRKEETGEKELRGGGERGGD